MSGEETKDEIKRELEEELPKKNLDKRDKPRRDLFTRLHGGEGGTGPPLEPGVRQETEFERLQQEEEQKRRRTPREDSRIPWPELKRVLEEAKRRREGKK